MPRMGTSNKPRRLSSRALAAGIVCLLLAGALIVPAGGSQATGLSATAPDLGVAASFAVLAGSTVTNTGPSIVNGDLGVWPGTAITGFPPGIVNGTIHAGDAVAQQAQSDVTIAYNDLAGQPCDVNLTGTDLGGLTLTTGVYCFDTSAQLTGPLVLDAQGDPQAVWVFQMGSTLTTASNSSVAMINAGNLCNVFWQVGSSATLGTDTQFIGNILAYASITLTTGAQIDGRVLAINGAVTMDSNLVSNLPCWQGALHLWKTKMGWANVMPPYYLKVVVRGFVHDQDHALAAGVTVSGFWTYPDGAVHQVTTVTDAQGRWKVPLRMQPTPCGLYQFDVTNLTKPGYTYDPAANHTSPHTEINLPCAGGLSGPKDRDAAWRDGSTTQMQEEVDAVHDCVPVHDADFTFSPDFPNPGQVVDFLATAQGDEPISYVWDLGDGTAGSGPEFYHAYTYAGTYLVMLTATNACGQQGVQHEVLVQPPQAHYLHLLKQKMNWRTAVPPNYKASVQGIVHDETHAFLAGVTVTGHWTYPDGGTETVTAVTDALGRYKLLTKKPQCGLYQFDLDNLAKAGYTDDPAHDHGSRHIELLVPCK